MRRLVLTSLLLLGMPSVCADNVTDQIQLLNSQIQAQLQNVQQKQQQQIKTLNTQLQTQLKQMQSDLQAQIQKVNTQTQAQMKHMQTTLQQQIQQFQENATGGTKK